MTRSYPGSTRLLFDLTTSLVFQSFAKWDHKITKRNREAIEELAYHLALSVNCALSPKFYLSTMDVGLGKSVTIKSFLKALLDSSSAKTATGLRHSQVGVLLCLSTYDEIASVLSPDKDRETNEVVVGTVLDPKKVFVLVGRSAEARRVAAMGKAPSTDEAQIIITTHAKIEVEFTKVTQAKFWETSCFKYKHGFRIVRLWDESFVPNRPHTITTRNLLKLQAWLEGRVPEKLMVALHDMVGAMRQTKHKALYLVPDLEDAFGNTFDHIEGMVRRTPKKTVGELEDVLTTVEALRVMSGCMVAVRKHDGSSKSALTYEPMIPKDFAPVVIADASGAFKKSYRDIARRGELVHIKSVRKSYAGNLTIHWYDVATGRGQWSAFLEKGHEVSGYDRLVAETCKVIVEEPDRKQLVITFKPNLDGPYRGRFPSIEEGIRKHLADRYPDYDPIGDDPDQPRLAFLTFGRHRATNTFKSYPVVTLAGVLIKSDSANEALLRASREVLPEKGEVHERDVLSYRAAEMADDLCQAAGRGTIRETDNEEPWKCPKGSRLNVMVSRTVGAQHLFPIIYGKNTKVVYHGDKSESSGKSLFDEAVEELTLAAKKGQSLTFAKFRKHRDWKGRGVVSKRLQDTVRTDPRYPDLIARLGFEEAANEGGNRVNQWKFVGSAAHYFK